MADRVALVQCFRDTIARIRDNADWAEVTRQMQAATRLFPAEFRAENPVLRQEPAVIEVTADTTLHCAQRLLQEGAERVAVLNFANAYRPGGGVTTGAMAQEECLCRSSNLYESLTIPEMKESYYHHNALTTDALGTDAVIYTPGVLVIKNDETVPQPIETPFAVDVLTCAAPDLRGVNDVPQETVEGVVVSRARNILEVASSQGADALVLGAFGCGVFRNPPEMVAGAFRRLLLEEGYAARFARVVFAIKANDAANSNLVAFRRVFEAMI